MKKARKSDSKKHSKPLKTIEIQKKSNIRPEIVDSQEKGGAILVNPRIYGGLINENQVDEWVRGNALIAQGTIVELVYRLVTAAAPNPKDRRFPLGDSIGQPGPDGFLNTDIGYAPFVPEGKSYWEIGTGANPGKKATSDYKSLTDSISKENRQESVFVFVTPISGRKKWSFTSKKNSQATWLEKRRKSKEWRDVHVIDGTRLIDWQRHFPAVGQWFARNIGIPSEQIQTLEKYWDDLKTIGAPLLLTPQLFLANRDEASKKLDQLFLGNITQLQIDTYFPDQVVAFISAYVAAIKEKDRRDEILGTCLIISDSEAWNVIADLSNPQILVANFDVDGSDGTVLLNRARRKGHRIIIRGMPGGVPHPDRVLLGIPKSYQIKEELGKAGYSEERARIFSQKSGGDLSLLLRCIQNISLLPGWAQNTTAADLAIVEFLGAWDEKSEADKRVAEVLSKKAYGEWIKNIREIARHPGTPLMMRDGKWKFVARYEGWYALGPNIFDEHLDRLKEIAVSVLRERDPKYDLPPDERFAASIHGKVLAHSDILRKGLAESLALLGSHQEALTSCSFGKADGIAILSVREILADADWIIWASLDDLLPLLAEASPVEFLDAVEKALKYEPCPFDMLFAQEGNGIMGRNYTTGLLWALETLAWDTNYLTRVIVILGELASRDPGGTWANRPANSLTTILLPWLPQTCAPVLKRQAAVATLLDEFPEVAWTLLLSLLPGLHQSSFGSHKPSWREMIDDNWKRQVNQKEYWEQINAYSELTVNAAKRDVSKLVELIKHLDNLPQPARDQILSYLRSDAIVSMAQTDRLGLWTELVDLVSRHRKYSSARWALEPKDVDAIAEVAENLIPKEPFFRHQRLFNTRELDLFEEKSNYNEQSKILEEKRKEAIHEIFADGGTEEILEFAKVVESPWKVGYIFGLIADKYIDKQLLPSLLESENKAIAQFIGMFVAGRFRIWEWPWVDEIDTAQWSPSQKGQFLAYLPFITKTWERSAKFLKEDETPYWSKTNALPYDAKEDISQAIDYLLKYNRPNEAIRCLDYMIHEKMPFDTQQAVRALLQLLQIPGGEQKLQAYDITEVIKAIQDKPDANPEDLAKIEFAYLPLLDRFHDASPILLERCLADDPAFFCKIIHMVFKSKKKDAPVEEYSEKQKEIAHNAFQLLYNWKTPPGSRKDGTFGGEALNSWLKEVKASCIKSGHYEIALEMVGHVLAHSPHDPSGFWLDHSVAKVLNAKDAKELRIGFRLELFNSRGVHAIDPKGKDEEALAKKYNMQAEEVEAHGYHRLADSLRELASMHKRESERQISRDDFDD